MKQPEIQIMPSLLAADFAHLSDACKRVESSGAEQLHMDIMDGIFVPNISFGPALVEMAAGEISIPQNVHLMIIEPQRYIEAFAKAGAETILIHAESRCELPSTLQKIRDLGCRAGITVNPETPVDIAVELAAAGAVDEVLVMSVHPGFGGQKYIPSVEEKLRVLRKANPELDLSIDGGIDAETVLRAAAAGANLFVAGSYLFKQPSMKDAVEGLRASAEAVFAQDLEG